MRSALDIWNTPSPPVVIVSLSFYKNIKVFWENVSVLTEECNHDSVALIMSKVM